MLGTMAGLWISLIVFIIAGVMLVGIAAGKGSADSMVKIEKKSALHFDLSGNISDRYQPTSFMQLIQNGTDNAPTLEEMILALRKAADDNDIEGLYLQCGGSAMGTASRQELVEAIEYFKQSGKWVYAYSDNYSQGDYLIASTADNIVLNPLGAVDIHGVGGMTPFFKGLLDKLGVKMQIIKVGTYKSAVEPYILTSMSEPARRQMQQYVDSIWNYVAGTIAENRGISPDDVKALAGEYISTRTAETFVADKLADTLLYARQADNELRTLCDISLKDDLKLVSPGDYLSARGGANGSTSKKHIALLYAIGDIVDAGSEGIVGSKMVNEIIDLADNDKVEGMVFRVNSPGGSAFASEQIWEALQYFKSKGKPLYVSMGDYAASGGYYISCGADSIFADRTTLTGSIGVFGMIPDFHGLVTDKLGVNFSTVETNPGAVGLNGFEPMNPKMYAAMQQSVENIYDIFTKRVADGRHMSQDSVKAIAEGRVWVGGDAINLGLVDALGSLQTTVEALAENLGLDADKDVVSYPLTEEKFWEKLMRESAGLDQIKEAGYDAQTLQLLQHVRNIAKKPSVQARMEYIITE